MKKMTLRVRFTLVASLFLLISCMTLAILSNFSANRIINAVELQESYEIGNIKPFVVKKENLLPAIENRQISYELFRKESIIATCIIVLIGSAATYFAAGYVLKPITYLSKEVKKRNIDNFSKVLSVPQSSDEIQDLTVSFNQLLLELQHSFTLQQQFSANAAHELRTPLAILQTKLDVFSLSKEIDQETREFVAHLQVQLERLTVLIDDLLLFSRDLPLDSVDIVPLMPLLEDVVEELSNVAMKKQIEISLDGLDCTVKGQDLLLERVFYNLVENSIKYSPCNTKIEISVTLKKDQRVVTITDQGEGIPEDCRDSIFEPFFRVDKSRSRAIGGSGLGLAICKKILDRHHATICVIANEPAGSIFEISFPA